MTASSVNGAPSVLVVRPYPTSLRDRMHDVLREVGLDMDGAEKIPLRTPDAEAIARVIELNPPILLVPFNAHRDTGGELVNGMTLCGRLAQASRAPQPPVIMPISNMATANLHLISRSGRFAALYTRLLGTQILVFEPDDLRRSDATTRVIQHLRGHGIRLPSRAR